MLVYLGYTLICFLGPFLCRSFFAILGLSDIPELRGLTKQKLRCLERGQFRILWKWHRNFFVLNFVP